MLKNFLAVLLMAALPAYGGTWSRVGSGTCNEAASAASQTLTFTGTVNSGDVIWILGGCSTTGKADPTVSSSLSSTTFTKLLGPITKTGVGDGWLYAAKAGAGGTNPTFTVQFASACTFHEEIVEVQRSTVTINPSSTGANSSTGTGTVASVTISPATSTNLAYIGMVFDDGGNALTAGGTFTVGCRPSGTGNGAVFLLNSTGGKTPTGTSSNAGNWIMLGAAWDEAAGGTASYPGWYGNSGWR